MNLNKVFLVGRITKEIELKQTAGGTPVTSFSLATNKTFTDRSGSKQEKTEFHNVVAWGKLAEVISTYCVRGQEIMIEGSLQTRMYENDKGKHYFTEVVASGMQFGQKPSGMQQRGRRAPQLEDEGSDDLGQYTQELDSGDIDAREVKAEDLPY